jgi:hypothetical protein
MSTICYSGVEIPTPISEVCQNNYTSTKCILHLDAPIILNLPAQSSVYDIITKQNTILVSQNQRIIDLESKASVNNITVAPLGLAQLNTTYPLAGIGFEVQCLLISIIYKKTITGWVSQMIAQVV